MHVGAALGSIETPAIVEIFERPVDIFDVDCPFRGIEQNLRGEGLANGLVTHGHIRHQQRLAIALLAGAHGKCFA